ncbi:gliding motility-associated ABC transporter ATP-binding subunit GldA [Aquimarina sp. ERC-38]|uniref:gliding motility-associated ABC transporter ATP-binding subunit GldA n=1 Tax=Aquimarina sp. ERC-38 TaxID=2949996 RepID=UPI002247DAD2|nr:gliding motility-associated ABC transporter ATP-binding subunit GldA [Aquimarina sp. ERC-38]UZO80984.1 gliding motility-associated ABC transporter ATP-binding subunit GldA [Aquimarina sp. ERC-38]
MSISVQNLSKHYGEQKALDDVSFEIKKGEIVGFLGPNGAGKSTLMKILTTYLLPDEGVAMVNGFNVLEDEKRVQQSVGYLPEHNPLYDDMYVKEYLRFNADLHSVSKDSINNVIKITGLAPEVHKKIKQLSKGYKQRVGLACALIHDPEVLILDEPTTGLDPNQIMEIRELIRTISTSKTIFLSTHIMQEVEAICDRVIIISKGNIVVDQELDELLNQAEQIVLVEFDYRVDEAFLLQLPHAKKATNTFGFAYEIHFNTTKDMRSFVFDFAHDNQLKIVNLSRKNKNLESLFHEVTENA